MYTNKGINTERLKIGPDHPVFIIAEAGINHEGDLSVAFDLVDAAAETGADAVKFQTFVTELVITRRTPKANYHIETTGGDDEQTWFELIKSEELPPEAFFEIKRRCDDKGIIFLSTPYDMPSVDTLVKIGVPAIKIASTDTNNLPLLKYMAGTGVPLFLSTGMSSLEELDAALGAIKDGGCDQLVVMQCTAEYPAPHDQINLKAMRAIADRYGVAVGYSDHCPGSTAALGAVALGATVYEKHFTLDKNAQGPDHRASMEPDELKTLVDEIRALEAMLGDGEKVIMPCEAKNKPILQKCIVANGDLAVGDVLAEENMLTKRTGGIGLSPLVFYDVVGRPLAKAVGHDEPITEDMLG